ncbi:GNAT family N-acetyltransferase [Williamsia sterculiae]|uniref:Ribosomal protein S18 acetylase RimI n=1 Tax=Williamsia sterculiae TaxID=1344003 RepID=A0A1N7EGA6_9NOCA|nr:GNAT family N-acetyltransferase [Williamsia sterculiae]SIR86945.1 Ribosomal protein S18 acetylase RimI [Williamsia sterculiae]
MNDAAVHRVTDPADAEELASVAAATFPLACPPSTTAEAAAAFTALHLTAEKFRDHLTADDRDVFAARDDTGAVIGYCLLIHADPTADDVRTAIPERPVCELSKMYVLPGHHGARVSHALMAAAVAAARDAGAVTLWLGVNQENVRAQKFYRKTGFEVAGEKTFDVGGRIEHDFVMRLPLT